MIVTTLCFFPNTEYANKYSSLVDEKSHPKHTGLCFQFLHRDDPLWCDYTEADWLLYSPQVSYAVVKRQGKMSREEIRQLTEKLSLPTEFKKLDLRIKMTREQLDKAILWSYNAYIEMQEDEHLYKKTTTTDLHADWLVQAAALDFKASSARGRRLHFDSKRAAIMNHIRSVVPEEELLIIPPWEVSLDIKRDISKTLSAVAVARSIM